MSPRLLFMAVLAAAYCEPACAKTARQVIADIQLHLGIESEPGTVDTFKAGNPDTPVTGIAVTMMATYDVLERAAASGRNLVITHEPTFYNHLDTTAALEKQQDAVLAQKQAFIADHKMVVWRFHDGWHAHSPDGILLGMTKALGWERLQNPNTPALFDVPKTSLRELALTIRHKLQIAVPRVVGDADLQVTKVAFLPGAAGSAKQIKLLERPDVEVLVIGETPEWETVEYVSDAASQKKRKALIILGHIPSEQAGMQECAAWIQTFISDVPVSFVPAREPFWLPVEAHH